MEMTAIIDRRVKTALNTLLPARAVDRIRGLRRELAHLHNRRRSPKEIFSEAYRKHTWGGEGLDFFSGSGSDLSVSQPYAEAVRRFISENRIRSMVDLGCGDFRVGSLLKTDSVSYLGIDVVPSLIARNQAQWAADEVSFQCLDIVADDLPRADLCLIRQVLQHLSNQQIHAIVSKLHQYRAVLVTEHYPSPDAGNIVANKDKPAGPDTRIPDRSAVFLDMPPFRLEPKGLLLDVEVSDWLVAPGERLKTFIFEHPKPAPFENAVI